ncbi:hypothetical protein GCM10011360_07720 [Primorskyibacter flagellatus]|uniref:VPLPA-CTERM protein sorting domain-containing protein n=2 Tax=Primorskyibacter flagellatus TaxID=1387277 RepID=A0A917A1C8_9RHOB|nr:hypothetical protein GCM10011360_07720 [Primorskyibacter flagellatus]
MKNLFLAISSVAALSVSPVAAATLLHSYDFEGSGVMDGTGSVHGTLFGGATVAGGYLVLDGIDGYAELDGGIVPDSGDFSVAIRARQDSVQSGYFELISEPDNYSGIGQNFYIGGGETGEFRLGDQTHPGIGVDFPTDLLFHTYVLTSSLTEGTKLYLDGLLVYSDLDPTFSPIGTNTRFGRQYGGNQEYFHGVIDDIRIYSGVLTPEEAMEFPEPLPTPAVPVPAGLPLLVSALGLAAGLTRRKR